MSNIVEKEIKSWGIAMRKDKFYGDDLLYQYGLPLIFRTKKEAIAEIRAIQPANRDAKFIPVPLTIVYGSES